MPCSSGYESLFSLSFFILSAQIICAVASFVLDLKQLFSLAAVGSLSIYREIIPLSALSFLDNHVLERVRRGISCVIVSLLSSGSS